eukprot:GHVQ01023045.1.p1 GENE.GHVQ01023045.1~~GHVQ01023045.1.p1  ORF type:complete len:444 (+),score=31.69 GHVQ01023045.1:314-1645(+)
MIHRSMLDGVRRTQGWQHVLRMERTYGCWYWGRTTFPKNPEKCYRSGAAVIARCLPTTCHALPTCTNFTQAALSAPTTSNVPRSLDSSSLVLTSSRSPASYCRSLSTSARSFSNNSHNLSFSSSFAGSSPRPPHSMIRRRPPLAYALALPVVSFILGWALHKITTPAETQQLPHQLLVMRLLQLPVDPAPAGNDTESVNVSESSRETTGKCGTLVSCSTDHTETADCETEQTNTHIGIIDRRNCEDTRGSPEVAASSGRCEEYRNLAHVETFVNYQLKQPGLISCQLYSNSDFSPIVQTSNPNEDEKGSCKKGKHATRAEDNDSIRQMNSCYDRDCKRVSLILIEKWKDDRSLYLAEFNANQLVKAKMNNRAPISATNACDPHDDPELVRLETIQEGYGRPYALYELNSMKAKSWIMQISEWVMGTPRNMNDSIHTQSTRNPT